MNRSPTYHRMAWGDGATRPTVDVQAEAVEWDDRNHNKQCQPRASPAGRPIAAAATRLGQGAVFTEDIRLSLIGS
jgi:hypothetical protein